MQNKSAIFFPIISNLRLGLTGDKPIIKIGTVFAPEKSRLSPDQSRLFARWSCAAGAQESAAAFAYEARALCASSDIKLNGQEVMKMQEAKQKYAKPEVDSLGMVGDVTEALPPCRSN